MAELWPISSHGSSFQRLLRSPRRRQAPRPHSLLRRQVNWSLRQLKFEQASGQGRIDSEDSSARVKWLRKNSQRVIPKGWVCPRNLLFLGFGEEKQIPRFARDDKKSTFSAACEAVPYKDSAVTTRVLKPLRLEAFHQLPFLMEEVNSRLSIFLRKGLRGRLVPVCTGTSGPEDRSRRLPLPSGRTARRTVTAKRARTHPQAWA